ncbi:MAG: type IV pilus twitching motility protein PilT [Cyanobium sp.]
MAELPFGPVGTAAPPPPPPQPPPAIAVAPEVLPGQSAAAPGEEGGPQTLREIVALAHERKYSDIHIGVGEQPCFRDRGDINRTDWPVTDSIRFRDWVREMLSPNEIDSFLRDKEYDGAYDFGFVRVRINLLDSLRGPAMVLRLIPQKIMTMQELDLPPILGQLAERPKGMLLVTGPTGSGKSTTLAAMIDHINRTMKRHILTIENPIEFVHQSRMSLIRQREVHQHTRLFANALRAALREDPDVILIGEIRDQETLSTAIEASQTGHLVFGTLHTNSAVRTVERILGMFKPDEQEQIRRAVSETLLAVVSQGLVKTTDGKRCGYHDLFVNTDACRDYIQRGALDEIEEIMVRSTFDGMQTSNQALAALVEAGRVAADDALAQSSKPGELAQRLRGRV